MENMFHIENKSRAPAVDRAMAILRLLAQAQEPQGVSAISRTLGVGKSAAHGILQALLAVDAIEDVGGRRYRIGPLVEELARSRHESRLLSEVCRPYLAELAAYVGQTSVVGTPEGDRLRIVAVAEGQGALQVKVVQGGSVPLLAGAVGKIIFAWEVVPIPEVLPRFTEDTVVDVQAFGRELARVRREGLALDRGEYLRGICAAASPVLKGGHLVAVLFSPGFQDQLGEEGLMVLGRAVAQAARDVSGELSKWKVKG